MELQNLIEGVTAVNKYKFASTDVSNSFGKAKPVSNRVTTISVMSQLERVAWTLTRPFR